MNLAKRMRERAGDQEQGSLCPWRTRPLTLLLPTHMLGGGASSPVSHLPTPPLHPCGNRTEKLPARPCCGGDLLHSFFFLVFVTSQIVVHREPQLRRLSSPHLIQDTDLKIACPLNTELGEGSRFRTTGHFKKHEYVNVSSCQAGLKGKNEKRGHSGQSLLYRNQVKRKCDGTIVAAITRNKCQGRYEQSQCTP